MMENDSSYKWLTLDRIICRMCFDRGFYYNNLRVHSFMRLYISFFVWKNIVFKAAAQRLVCDKMIFFCDCYSEPHIWRQLLLISYFKWRLLLINVAGGNISNFMLYFCFLLFFFISQAGFEALFRSFDPEVQFQYFRSFRRVRISFSDALAAAEARLRLNKTDFNGKEMRLYFAQVLSLSCLITILWLSFYSHHLWGSFCSTVCPHRQSSAGASQTRQAVPDLSPCLTSSWVGTVKRRHASYQLRPALCYLKTRTRYYIRHNLTYRLFNLTTTQNIFTAVNPWCLCS